MKRPATRLMAPETAAWRRAPSHGPVGELRLACQPCLGEMLSEGRRRRRRGRRPRPRPGALRLRAARPRWRPTHRRAAGARGPAVVDGLRVRHAPARRDHRRRLRPQAARKALPVPAVAALRPRRRQGAARRPGPRPLQGALAQRRRPVPPLGFHMLCYYGVFASHHHLRARIVPAAAAARAPARARPHRRRERHPLADRRLASATPTRLGEAPGPRREPDPAARWSERRESLGEPVERAARRS